MLKTNLLLVSLVMGLVACSSGAAVQPVPVEVKSGQGDAALMAETEKAVAAEEAMVKAEEPMAEDTMTEESMVKAEEPAAETAMTEEAMVETEEPAMEDTMTKESLSSPAAMKDPLPVPSTTPLSLPGRGDEMAGPTEVQARLLAGLKNQSMPPELFNQVWLNSDPLKLADLHGKVVIVEFWTFGCYNCKNVVPSLRAWHHTYSDEGLVIIGVHTPEFGYERELENVKQALIDQDIPYAVTLDNDWQTWRAYNNRYWPAKYFIDKAGNLRHVAIGEGGYDEQEAIIQALLAEKVS